MVELAVRNLSDAGLTRKKAALATGVIGFALGIPSALSIPFQENQDWVWGVGLLISGVLFSYAVYRKGIENVRRMINRASWIKVGRWFNICVLGIPAVFLILFIWWVWQSVSWYPQTWWNPFEKTSPATMAVQWALLFILVLALNRWLARRIKAPHPEDHGPDTAPPVTP